MEQLPLQLQPIIILFGIIRVIADFFGHASLERRFLLVERLRQAQSRSSLHCSGKFQPDACPKKSAKVRISCLANNFCTMRNGNATKALALIMQQCTTASDGAL